MRVAVMTGVMAVMCLAAIPVGAADGVTFIPASQVAGAFEKGQPLLETGLYKVHASRRESPGMVEVHVRDTDIIYVLQGSAAIVTGGRMIGGQVTATDEIRGASIEGGTEQQLTKGDVFVVPNGVPHWFTRIDGPFTYFVVKATSVAASGGTQ